MRSLQQASSSTVWQVPLTHAHAPLLPVVWVLLSAMLPEAEVPLTFMKQAVPGFSQQEAQQLAADVPMQELPVLQQQERQHEPNARHAVCLLCCTIGLASACAD